MLFLNAAHHHAEVAGLDNHADPLGFQDCIQRIADLLPQPFLNLQTPCKNIDDPGYFAQSDDEFVRDVSDVHFSEERQEVMFAERVTFDVFDDDHAVGVRRKERSVDDFFQALFVAGCEEREGIRAALRRAPEPLSLRVLADRPEE